LKVEGLRFRPLAVRIRSHSGDIRGNIHSLARTGRG